MHQFSNKPHIYLITNLVNGKKYIGQTNGNTSYYFCSGNIIKRSIAKRGKHNFSRVILEEGEFSKQELNDLEAKYILQYDTLVPKGYNIAKFGTGTFYSTHAPWNKGGKHSPETVEKLRVASTGRIQSAESRLKNSETKKAKGIMPIRSAILKSAELNSKPLLQYDLEGNFLRLFKSYAEAERFISIETGKSEVEVRIKNKGKTYYGYIWKPYTENYPLKLSIDLDFVTRKVQRIKLNGKTIMYKNIRESSKALKLELNLWSSIESIEISIRNSARLSKSYKKNYFKYLNKEENE